MFFSVKTLGTTVGGGARGAGAAWTNNLPYNTSGYFLV